MRLFDLILAVAVLAALLFIAQRQFPAYEGKAVSPSPPASSAASPTPTASP